MQLLLALVTFWFHVAAPAFCNSDVIGPCTVQGGKVFQVDLADAAPELKTSASVAAGLINRQSQSPKVFMNLLPADKLWLASLQAEEASMQNCSWTRLTIPELWQLAHDTGAANGVIIYNPAEPWSLATVVTLCGIHKALPMPARSSRDQNSLLQAQTQRWLDRIYSFLHWLIFWGQAPDYSPNDTMWDTVFDVSGMWNDSYAATAWAWDILFKQCQNTDQTVAIQSPELMQQGLLADLIVSQQLFAFWLPDMCSVGTASQRLYDQITSPAWLQGHLLTVLGYFPTQEVIATCSKHHTEVTLASDWSPNLSFLSMMAPVHNLTQTNPLPVPQYDGNHTYVAIIASDGDNMQMDYNNKRIRMDERQAVCEKPDSICPPVSWTISNRLTHFAPYVLKWHYRQAARSKGKDSFLLGPSGYGFLHPSLMAPSDPARHDMIEFTKAVASALDLNAYVHWDDYNNALVNTTSHAAPHEVNSASEKNVAQPDYVPKGWLDDVLGAGGDHRHDTANAVVQGNQRDSLAMEAYIRHFENSSICSVFSPIMPYVADWMGNVATFRELVRWSNAESAKSVASKLMALSPGTLGYLYQLPDVGMQAVEVLGNLLEGSNVTLVDHRHLHDLALSKLR